MISHRSLRRIRVFSKLFLRSLRVKIYLVSSREENTWDGGYFLMINDHKINSFIFLAFLV